jgi:hypothetical protein
LNTSRARFQMSDLTQAFAECSGQRRRSRATGVVITIHQKT